MISLACDVVNSDYIPGAGVIFKKFEICMRVLFEHQETALKEEHTWFPFYSKTLSIVPLKLIDWASR